MSRKKTTPSKNKAIASMFSVDTEKEENRQLSLEKKRLEDELSKIKKSSDELKLKIKEINGGLNLYYKKYREREKDLDLLLIKKDKYSKAIINIKDKHIKTYNEVKKIKSEYEVVKKKIELLDKEKKTESYNLNKNKVALQQAEKPTSYKVLGIYLTAATAIGILLAVYYIFFYSKG